MKIRALFFALVIVFIAHSGFSQSLVGTWKRVSTVLIDKDNIATDLQKMMAKSIPCSVNITYTFEASGLQKTNIPEDCKKRLASIAAMYADAKYELNGSMLKVFSSKKELFPDAVYKLSFQGNKMTWVHNYSDNPKDPNPTKAKTITIVYQKL